MAHPIQVGINGFGRIGRKILRLALSRPRVCRLGLGKVAVVVVEGAKGLLQVQRDRVEDLRADSARGKKLAELVSAGGADYVLMPCMPAAGCFLWEDEAVSLAVALLGKAGEV